MDPGILPPPSSRWQPPSVPEDKALDMVEWPSFEHSAPDDPRCEWSELPPDVLREADMEQAEEFIAQPTEALQDAELVYSDKEPPMGGWLESDGAPVTDDSMTVELCAQGTARQTVLSRDWVHVDCATPVRVWTVRATKATYSFGDIYWGYSEAQCFSQKGRTFVYDVRGNARYGFHPLDLFMCETRSGIEKMGSTEFEGAFEGRKDDQLVITLDLRQQTLSVQNSRTGDRLVQKLPTSPPVRCARLCASLRTKGDTLAILA